MLSRYTIVTTQHAIDCAFFGEFLRVLTEACDLAESGPPGMAEVCGYRVITGNPAGLVPDPPAKAPVVRRGYQLK